VEEKKNDLCERLFEFAVRVIEFLKTLPYSPSHFGRWGNQIIG